MATTASSLVSSASRKLPIRRRPDLIAARHRFQGQACWMVKEPLGLTYSRLEDEEYALLGMLDGHTSIAEIKTRFEAQFAPQKISLEEIQQFLSTLHQSGLVIADSPGQGTELYRRGSKRKQRERKAAWTNLLSIRLRGFDPSHLLDLLYPLTRWCFSPLAIGSAIALMLAAALLVLVHLETVLARLPSFQGFFAVQNWFYLALTLAITKILHEFGHALTCKHFGGECHEMGMMFLIMTPCLYVNVTDSWMISSRWKRAAIGAAGMFVELTIASAATFLWWFSTPGFFNYLCLSTMFVCSVSTLAFNANPLMRYDGYYILSDLVEIPNLRQKASSVLQRRLSSWCLGLESPVDPFLPRRHRILLGTYAIAAAVYRWIITFSILWFLYKVFEPYRLEIIGQLLAIGSLYGLIVYPLWQVVRFFHVPGRIYQVKRMRLFATLMLLVALFAGLLFAPLPAPVYCTLEVKPRAATPVYVDVPGVLAEVQVKPGDRVVAGQVLGKLSSVDLQLDIDKLQGKQEELQSHLASLQQQRFRDDKAGLEIAEVSELLNHVTEQLAQKQKDIERLELTAPVAGTVLLPPAVKSNDQESGELATWSGTPLESKNLGSTLLASTLFCQIGNPVLYDAMLALDQADIPRITEHQKVEIQLVQLPGQKYRGEIEEIANHKMDVTSAKLSSKTGGELATETDASGNERPTSTTYQARVQFDDLDLLLRQGLRGEAKIHAGWETLGSRLWRYVARTFNFEL
jgi:putative peptide zinc metalloprotease protein